MPVISKKYFRAASPSVFGPYIIGIQSDKSVLINTHQQSYRSVSLYLPSRGTDL